MATRQDFAQAILQQGGWPVTDSNIQFLLAWMNREGGHAANNPMNTTRDADGATDYNSVGVKNYSTMEDGVNALVATLNEHYYGNVRAALASGDATSWDRTGRLAQDLHAWSAGPNAPMSKGYTSVTGGGVLKNIATLAQGVVASVGSQVSNQAFQAGNLQASYGNIDGFLQSQAPELAQAMNDPHVQDLLRQWGAGQLSDVQFQNQLEASDWWKRTPLSARQELIDKATDPATAEQKLNNMVANINNRAAQLGIGLPSGAAQDIAEKTIANNWGADQQQEALAQYAKYQGDITYKGEAATDVNALRGLYQQMALPADNNTLNTQLQNVLGGKLTLQDIQDQLAQQAATFYAANPQLAEFLKSGQGTARQWASPLITQAANLLGTDPNSVDLTNAQWSFLLKPQVDPRTGQSTGQAQTLDSVEAKIKTDPVYQYSKTSNGINDYQHLVDTLQQTFTGGRVA